MDATLCSAARGVERRLKQAADARHEAESALRAALESYHVSSQTPAAVTGAPAVDSDGFLEACTSSTSALTATCLQAADDVGHWLLKARVANLESPLVQEAASLMRRLHQEETAAMVEAGAQMTSIGYSVDEANALFAERAMEVAIEASGSDGEAFRKFVSEQGM